jgi:hypothetical protein
MRPAKYDALIAAGGFARRYANPALGLSQPKSLLMAGSRPLIFFTADNALKAGYRRLLVVNNRPEWHEMLREVLAPLGVADLAQDVGYSSTFLLARAFSGKMTDQFLFLYGHAPRSTHHLRALGCVKGGVTATAYSTSTKVNLIPQGDMFLEPPYLIDRHSVDISKALDWASYFADVDDQMTVYVSDGPGEPNSRGEVEKYMEYCLSLG